MSGTHDEKNGSTGNRSIAFRKAYGCLLGGAIGDAMGEPAEGKDYTEVKRHFGRIDDFISSGTDDTIMKSLLCEALIETYGWATLDDWARVWMRHPDAFFGDQMDKFFQSVLHTAVKLRDHAVPRMAALGNMPSSSSAMCIAPVGIVNACNPRQAALQAYNLAGLIHVHDVGFCQDAAAAVAAAVASAFGPEATVSSVIEAASEFILADSGKEMKELISTFLAIAEETGNYVSFRQRVYDDRDRLFRRILCDSRETVPIALSLFWLADGSIEKAVVYGANFGRDSDTIATIAGAVAGAFSGLEAIPKEWLTKIVTLSETDDASIAERLVETAATKLKSQERSAKKLRSILGM